MNDIGEDIMDLDLNQEPLESPSSPVPGLTPLLNELEVVHEHIEERIRQLEAVTSRIRQRQILRQGQRQTTSQLVDMPSVGIAVDTYDLPGERLDENGKMGKRDGAHLIAKALGVEKTRCNSQGGFFDCNICLDRAKDPILTCCGHLFCWPCFYLLPCSYSNIKECPVCEGEVSDTGIIPIYGNGSDCIGSHKAKLKDVGIDFPPRPHAKRIESVRQKLVTRGIPLFPIDETIQQMRRIIDAIGQRTRSQGNDAMMTNSSTSPNEQNQSNNAVVQQDAQHSGIEEVISLVPIPSGGFGVSNAGREMGSAVPSASSSARRRTDASYIDSGARSRSRRRRLR